MTVSAPNLRTVKGGTGVLPDHLPPQSIDAEQATLGAALIKTGAAKYVVETLRQSDFHSGAHQQVFAAISHLLSQDAPVDVMSVPEVLRERGELEGIGGVAYIHTLVETVPTAAHVDHYARIVLEKAELRDAETFSSTIARAVRDGEEPEAIYARMDRFITEKRARRSAGKGPQTITSVDLMALDIAPMRWAVEGLIPEGLTLLVAAPKIGKSWFAYQLGISVACGGVAFSHTRVEQGEALLLMLEDTKRRAKSRIGQLLADSAPSANLHIMTECPRMDEGGRQWLEEWLAAHPNCRSVVIDTLQMFRQRQTEKGAMYVEDYEAVGAIKRIADRWGVSIVVIHHVNKSKSEDIFNAVSGSNGVSGAADGTLIIERLRGEKGALLHVTGRDIEEKKLALRFEEHTAWEILGDAEEHARSREQDEVLDLLRQSYPTPMKAATVAQRLNQKTACVRVKLWRMANAGILSTDDGWFSLAKNYQPTEQNGAEGVMGETPVMVLSRYAYGVEPDAESITGVTPVTPVSHVTGITPTYDIPPSPFVDEPPLPLEEPPPGAAARLLYIAERKEWPSLELADPEGQLVTLATEANYRWVCEQWPEDALAAVLAALRGLGGL